MNKATSLALAGLMGMAAGAYATEARDAGLGAASQFIVDDAAFTTLPQEVLTYKGATYFELGTNNNNANYENDNDYVQAMSEEDNVWGGTNIPVGPGALGVWVNRPDMDFSPLYNNSQINSGAGSAHMGAPFTNVWNGYSVSDFYNDDTPRDRVDLIYAFDLSDAANLAIGVNRANYDWKNELGPNAGFNSFDGNNLGLTLGSDIKNLGFLKILQIGLQVNTESLDADVNRTTDNKFDSTATGFQIRVGGQTGNDEGGFSRIELGIQDGGLSVKTQPNVGNSYTDNGSGLSYNLGYAVGMNKDKGMGIVGIELFGTSSSDDNTDLVTNDKYSYSSINLLVSTAAEYKVKEWMTLRAGLSGSIYSNYSYSYTTLGNSTYNQSPYYGAGADPENYPSAWYGDGYGEAYGEYGSAAVSMGVTFNIGDIAIDGVLNQNILYTGSYLASGIPNPILGMVSGTWKWAD